MEDRLSGSRLHRPRERSALRCRAAAHARAAAAAQERRCAVSTINSRAIIDELIANDGYSEDDPRVAMIVEYTNRAGHQCWGVTWTIETPDRQRRYLVESGFVQQPRVLWAAEGGVR